MFPNTIPFDAITGATGKGDLADGNELRYQGNVFQTNPFWGAYNFYRFDQTDRFLGNASLKYNILDWLYVQGRAGTDFSQETMQATKDMELLMFHVVATMSHSLRFVKTTSTYSSVLTRTSENSLLMFCWVVPECVVSLKQKAAAVANWLFHL